MLEGFRSDRQLLVFERRVTKLIERGALACAESLTRELIRRRATDAFPPAAAAVTLEDLSITGWERLQADMLSADAELRREAGAPAAGAWLLLVNRNEDRELRIAHRILKSPGGRDIWWPGRDRNVELMMIRGLEPLTTVQRSARESDRLASKAIHPRVAGDGALAGALLLVLYHRLVETWVGTHGLPRPLPVRVGVDIVPHPCEVNVHDFSRQAERMLSAAEAGDLRQAARLHADREAGRSARWQVEVARRVAEAREARFLIDHWPARLIPFRSIHEDTLQDALRRMFVSDLGESEAPAWDVSPEAFEAALRHWANGMAPPNPAQAYLTIEPEARSALHAAFVRGALITCGPELYRRWINAGYSENGVDLSA